MVSGALIMYINYYIVLSMAILHHNNRLLLTTATTTRFVCDNYGHLVDYILNIRKKRETRKSHC